MRHRWDISFGGIFLRLAAEIHSNLSGFNMRRHPWLMVSDRLTMA